MARFTREDWKGRERFTFTPLYDFVAAPYGLVTAAVYGVVHRHCAMRDGVCHASIRRMAELVGLDRATILRHLRRLVQEGYLEDLTPDQRNKPHIYRDIYLGRQHEASPSEHTMPGDRA